MSQLIGKKGKGLEPGYVWLPYIMVVDKPVTVESNFSPKMALSSRYSNFSPKMALSSRYSSIIVNPIVNPKIEKIKKILEKIEDLNLTSS